MALNINKKYTCSITDLLYEVMEVSDKEWDLVETVFFKAGIYPEMQHTCISLDDNGVVISQDDLKWLNDALVSILKEANMNSLYIELD